MRAMLLVLSLLGSVGCELTTPTPVPARLLLPGCSSTHPERCVPSRATPVRCEDLRFVRTPEGDCRLPTTRHE